MSEQKFFTFKGYPLVRKDNFIYYGNMSDKYVTILNILSTRKVKDLEVADKIKLQLALTDPNVPAHEVIQKASDRDNLFDALDVAYIWLNKNNAAV